MEGQAKDLMAAHQDILEVFTLNEAEDSMKHDLHCTCAYRATLLRQMAAVEHQSELVRVMLEKEVE